MMFLTYLEILLLTAIFGRLVFWAISLKGGMRGVDTPPTEELGTPGETTPLSPVLKDEYIIWEIRKITPPNPIHPRTKKYKKKKICFCVN